MTTPTYGKNQTYSELVSEWEFELGTAIVGGYNPPFYSPDYSSKEHKVLNTAHSSYLR
jgi:hypothetical protein